MPDEDRLDIKDLAKKLGRTSNTIRQWMRREDFPKSAMPTVEGGRGKFYWTPKQAKALEDYAKARASARGWGGYHKQQHAGA